MRTDVIVILVADRNRHVRDLLQRELGAEGYEVRIARDGREVMAILDGKSPPNLLVLDLEIPFMNAGIVMEKLRKRAAPIPVIIHTFLADDSTCALEAGQGFTVVEKTGDTDRLRTAIDEMACRFYPDRYACLKQSARPQ
ncbi:MAG: response regulator [Syntrophobacteraceae bacterium]|nr:response regulator [Desulfobacteraceae bacterium]